jgi:hypothetical protein
VDHDTARRVRDYGGRVGTPSDARTFEVVAWPAERRLVLYVPEIEAATTVVAMSDADAAARSLIADLTGLDAGAIRCDIRLGRRGAGPAP